MAEGRIHHTADNVRVSSGARITENLDGDDLSSGSDPVGGTDSGSGGVGSVSDRDATR